METKLKIHTSFYIFLFFIIYFNGISIFFTYFLALIIHELSHYFVAKKYNILSRNINIYPFGMNVCVNMCGEYNNKKYLVYLIGPLVNILLLLITTSLWWYYPILYYYTNNFALANFCLGFFNLLPIYPLDGGNVILELLKGYRSKVKALKWMRVFAIIFGTFFLVIFILSCFYTLNFSCFCISFFMFSSVFSYKQILNNEINSKLKDSNVKQLKAYVVKLNTKYEEIEKCFDKNYFVQFYIVNDDNKIIKIVNENQIKKMYFNHLNGDNLINKL